VAGRARSNALSDCLNAKARDYFDVSPTDIALGAEQPSPLDYVSARLEDGSTTKELCRELSPTLGFELTYSALSRFLRERFGDSETSAALAVARSRASHCMAETALEIVDAPAYDSVTVQQARGRAAQRNWLAERWNRAQYGQSKDVNVQVSVTSLHIEALRAIAPQPVAVVPAPAEQPGQITDGSG